MEPARNVGGDFFDVLRLENGRIGVGIADVSDKGVPAALFMMSSRTLLKGAAIGNSGPGEVLHEVNDLLHQDNEASMFVTVVYAVYEPSTGELTYASGGHDAPLVVHADGSSTSLPLTGGIALGVVPDFPFRQKTVTLSPGDTVVLYTDGVTEAVEGTVNSSGSSACARSSRQLRRRTPGKPTGRSSMPYTPSPATPRCPMTPHANAPAQRAQHLSAKLSLKIDNRPAQLEQIPAAVEEIGRQESWPSGLVFRVNLVLEELGLNIIRHAYDDRLHRDRVHGDLRTGTPSP